MKQVFNHIDKLITDFLKCYALPFLRYSVALIFIWFGLLKVLDISPAQQLVVNTVYWVNPHWFVPFLGVWEMLIGICFLLRPLFRLGIVLLLPQMAGTFLPLVLLPDVVFTVFPYGLTMEGQYIIKNLVLLGAALVVGSHVREKKKKK